MYFQSFCNQEAFNKPSFIFLSLQFQFVNSYLSLFYIGFYLKDMERLKEVSNISLSALWTPPHQSFVSVPHSASDIRHCCSLPSSHHLLSLLTCTDSVNHQSTHHLYVGVRKMLLVLSLLRSLQRQVRVNLLPYLYFKIQMLAVSVPWFFTALLKSKVRHTALTAASESVGKAEQQQLEHCTLCYIFYYFLFGCFPVKVSELSPQTLTTSLPYSFTPSVRLTHLAFCMRIILWLWKTTG